MLNAYTTTPNPITFGYCKRVSGYPYGPGLFTGPHNAKPQRTRSVTEPHPDSAYLAVLDDVAEGDLIATACKRQGVTRKGLWAWSKRTPENGDAYARARLGSAAALEEEILERARAVTPESYSADNVVIQTLKWAAAKRHPKEYGDKVEVQQDTTLRVVVERVAAELAQPVAAPQLTATASLALPCE